MRILYCTAGSWLTVAFYINFYIHLHGYRNHESRGKMNLTRQYNFEIEDLQQLHDHLGIGKGVSVRQQQANHRLNTFEYRLKIQIGIVVSCR